MSEEQIKNIREQIIYNIKKCLNENNSNSNNEVITESQIRNYIFFKINSKNNKQELIIYINSMKDIFSFNGLIDDLSNLKDNDEKLSIIKNNLIEKIKATQNIGKTKAIYNFINDNIKNPVAEKLSSYSIMFEIDEKIIIPPPPPPPSPIPKLKKINKIWLYSAIIVLVFFAFRAYSKIDSNRCKQEDSIDLYNSNALNNIYNVKDIGDDLVLNKKFKRNISFEQTEDNFQFLKFPVEQINIEQNNKCSIKTNAKNFDATDLFFLSCKKEIIIFRINNFQKKEYIITSFVLVVDTAYSIIDLNLTQKEFFLNNEYLYEKTKALNINIVLGKDYYAYECWNILIKPEESENFIVKVSLDDISKNYIIKYHFEIGGFDDLFIKSPQFVLVNYELGIRN